MLITHGLAFFFGMYLTSVVNSGERISTYQEKLANVTEQNIDYKAQIMNNDTLKSRFNSLQNDYDYIKIRYTTLKTSCSASKTG